ncbi:MAG: TetR/AcrR family transcriptional regulator [Sciscionella sp.]
MGTERNHSAVQSQPLRNPVNRVDDDRLLDAVRARVLSVGVRRTTLTDVARHARVSRMTLYRRFPDVRSLVAALMTREFGGLLEQAAVDGAAAGSARERLVAGALSAARRLSANSVLRSMLDRDPELLLPYLLERVGTAQRFAEAFLTELVDAGHADGSIRLTDTTVQVRVLLFTVQTFAFSLRAASSDVDSEALLVELEAQLDGGLRPAAERT